MKNKPNFLFNLVIFLLFLAGSEQAFASVCWKATYGRGVGTIPGTCDTVKEDKSGLLCYNKCRSGYTGVAGVCWQNCPAGFTDTGAHCLKSQSYGRGDWSHTWALHNKGACDEQNKAVGGCEQWGAFYYQKCKKGFKPVLCCVCSPECPPGMKDIGVSCQKDSYVERPITPSCSASMEYDAGLCYNRCSDKFYGVGPVCWGKCPSDKPVDCGAMCGESATDCLTSVGEIVWAIGESVYKIAGIISTFGTSTSWTLATDAAKQAAIEGLKKTAKEVAKTVAKKLVGAAKTVVIGKVAAELKNMNVPAVLADKLAQMAADADNFDYLAFISGIDPLGFGKIAVSFVKPICESPPSSVAAAPADNFVYKAPQAQGPAPCALFIQATYYKRLTSKDPKEWTDADANLARQYIGRATDVDKSRFIGWPNLDLFSALTMDCNLIRKAEHYKELSTVPWQQWTDAQYERAIAVVSIATGIGVKSLQGLTKDQLKGFLVGSSKPW